MAIVLESFDTGKPDASFDLDGTVFKLNVLETYTSWLSQQGVFEPLPPPVAEAKRVWKAANTESNYAAHLGLLVEFFIEQVAGKSVTTLHEAAQMVAAQQAHRQWNITTALIDHLRESHNVISVSLMPEWLMEPFVRNLGFTALLGSTYISDEGVFTAEAHSIDKAEAYRELRGNDADALMYHMGDTSGDSSLFAEARYPILFNPSWTLLAEHAEEQPAIILSHKDVVTVLRSDNDITVGGVARFFGPPFDAEDILHDIREGSRA